MSSIGARNFVAPLDLRERKLLSVRMRLLPLLLVISLVIIALMVLKRGAPDSLLGALIPEHLGLSLLCLIPVYVYAVVLRMSLIRDLARGVKIVREVVLENKKKIDSDDSTSFRIFLTVSGSSPPLTFESPRVCWTSRYHRFWLRQGWLCVLRVASRTVVAKLRACSTTLNVSAPRRSSRGF